MSDSDAAPDNSAMAGTLDPPKMVQNNKVAPDLFKIPTEYEHLREKVTCHICGDFQPGLVYVCPRKHVFCRPCQVLYKGICSKDTCKTPLILAKDSLHDTVFEASTFKCIYAEHGCTQTVLGTYYTLHMASCHFRPGPRGVARNEKSHVIGVYYMDKRVTPEYAKAHEEQPNVIWSPQTQKTLEEHIKQYKSPFRP